MGLMVSSRPLIGLVVGTVFTLGLWGPHAFGDPSLGRAWFLRRAGAALLGGAPFALFLGWFNQRLFGNPFTLGYLAAFGERHRLGFHMDPWGYPYSFREAVAFTSSDLLSLGVQLLETPFPLTAMVGLYLLMASRLPKGVGVLVAWALLPVVANGYYWFHDVRMFFEAAPAWITLGVVAAVALAGDPGQGASPRDWGGRAADMATWAILFGVAGTVVWGTPTRWGGYRWSEERYSASRCRRFPPRSPRSSSSTRLGTSASALVFRVLAG